MIDVIVTLALAHAENAANSNERAAGAGGVANITATKLRQFAPLGTPIIITD